MSGNRPARGRSTRGLAYGEGPRQRLDVYRPRHAAKAPVLVLFSELTRRSRHAVISSEGASLPVMENVLPRIPQSRVGSAACTG